MSRIGKLPVNIPNGVEVNVKEGNFVEVKGPKGSSATYISDIPCPFRYHFPRKQTTAGL